MNCHFKSKLSARARISFSNNFNFFESQETVSVDFVSTSQKFNYPFASKFFSKTLIHASKQVVTQSLLNSGQDMSSGASGTKSFERLMEAANVLQSAEAIIESGDIIRSGLDIMKSGTLDITSAACFIARINFVPLVAVAIVENSLREALNAGK